MRIDAAGRELERALLTLACTPPENTALHRVADEIREMASAYCRDGRAFFERGDRVNALAAYSYAHGWIEGGRYLGLIVLEGSTALPRFTERVPDAVQPLLEEKARRYGSLLMRGLQALEFAPERSTALHGAALHATRVAEGMVAAGSGYHRGGDAENALACYSYGFAWLDAGIRAGLFRISCDRDLFTI
ncbi:MAG: DUF357 domain-containing protein [Methanomicrobiales archaeon]|nr:DUF357 domain-containing protein [Methanomicrobiales archaeon]